MREVSIPAFAAAHADGAVILDVREPHEYVAGHVPGARLVPLARLGLLRQDLPRTTPVYVICASGNRSKAAVDFLANAGIDAYSVAGGTAAWTNTGRPVVYGAHERAA